jgi:phytoene desaturase
MKKALVIGAGIGGLAAAVRLAVKGYQVEVFESNSYPGGKLSEFSLDGFRFDAGPSLFTMPELVEELYVLAGKNSKEYFEYFKLDKICNYFFSDGSNLIAYSDKERFFEEATLKTGVDKKRLIKHLKKSEFIYNATAHLFLERSLHSIKSYLRWKTFLSILQLPLLGIFKTMDQANKQVLKNEKMNQLFNRYATYNGSNPYHAPAILNIIPHLEFSKGAYFPSKGMYQITNAVYNLAKELGVVFHFNSKVEKIDIKDAKVDGIVVNKKNVNADLIICNSDIFPAYRNLLAGQQSPEKILSQERSSSALIFYWGMNKTFTELDLHNIFFTADYKNEFKNIFELNTIYEDPTVYINITSKYKSDDAPKGMENWFVMINVPSNKGQDWEVLKATAKKNILKKLSRHLSQDIGSLIIAEQVLDPITIETKTQSHQGALYGTSSNNRMSAFFRHPNFSNKIKNLYFCGGSVHPGGGIPLALSSAKIVDSLIPNAK